MIKTLTQILKNSMFDQTNLEICLIFNFLNLQKIKLSLFDRKLCRNLENFTFNKKYVRPLKTLHPSFPSMSIVKSILINIKTHFPFITNLEKCYYQCSNSSNNSMMTMFFKGYEERAVRTVFIKCIIRKQDFSCEYDAETYFFKKFQNSGTIELLYKKTIEETICNQKYQVDYFVFPYAHGGDFFTIFIENKYMPTNEVMIQIAYHLLSSLEKIHAKGGILRDVKLENIVSLDAYPFINARNIKFIDFGSCYIENISDPKRFKGTDDYYAPEFIFYHKVMPSMDIWSLGITFYCMIQKEFPTESPVYATREEFQAAFHQNKLPTFSHPVWTNFSPELRNLIRMMLTYDCERHPSAHDLLKLDMFQQCTK